MCGIVGMRRFDGRVPDVAVLRDMASLLRHRGPDGEGFLVRGSVGSATAACPSSTCSTRSSR